MGRGARVPLKFSTFCPIYYPVRDANLHHANAFHGPNQSLRVDERKTADASRQRDGLWWSTVRLNKAASGRVVVGHWATRRVKEAFVEALKDRGLDRNGVVINNAKVEDDVPKPRRNARPKIAKDLTGSLIIRMEAGAITAEKKLLDVEAARLVNWLYAQVKPASEPVSVRFIKDKSAGG
jgi:hypothetical protein